MERAERGGFGPGFLVAAAFVGPGTVTTASVAGAAHGFALAWAVVGAVAATVVLQEMASRLGAVAGVDLGTALRSAFREPVIRVPVVTLSLVAIAFGNAAYQGGNLTGAALGLTAVTGVGHGVWVLACASLAAVLLLVGAYRVVESVLVGMVALMSVVFVATALMVGSSLSVAWAVAWPPTVPAGSTMLMLALVGTTVVPYNLFLHASAARAKWGGGAGGNALRAARRDTFVAVLVGGAITLAILTTAVPLHLAGLEVDGAGAMASQLEPLLGSSARIMFGVGLFAAGLTSAITAPLAAAWAAAGLLGWGMDLRSWRLRAVWAAVIAVGAGVALSGFRPVEAILFAQAANGLLLPLIAGFLLWVMNRGDVVGGARNGALANAAGSAVVVFAFILSITILYRVFFT